MCRAKVSKDVFLRIPAFLGANHDNLVGSETSKSSNHSPVFRVQTVSMQFGEAGEGALQIVQRERALRMTRNLNSVPRAQIAENLPLGFLDFLFDDCDFFLEADSQGMFFRMLFQLLKLAL